jgi:hypothetical protein
MSPQPTQTVGRFRLRNQNFACELENFACETFLLRQAPSKLLKSLAHEISVFAVSCDFKGLRPIFFRALLRRPFSDPPRGPRLNSASQNSSLARIRLQGKSKGESRVCTFVRFHGNDRLVACAAQIRSVRSRSLPTGGHKGRGSGCAPSEVGHVWRTPWRACRST